MAGIPIVHGGKVKTLVSTQGYDDAELERIQLTIEDLLVRAHATGLNQVAESVEVFIGAVWTSREQERQALAGEKTALGLPTGRRAQILPPAKRGRYIAEGAPLGNPVLAYNLGEILGRFTKLGTLREQGSDNDRITFMSDDPRYPSLVLGYKEK